ncbi:hypothetical protein FXF51_54755 [Nonomuraea sp. PA05]|uniref:hypothetical protein n=1 Tax=Nonomuraea sp. PA05 TaxID=2604466 RepID=UPI0011DAAC59|nr:hypothetical protein [Nonomuraea sp. PA05]TYB50940.1 hypothetical protein FXF51_54755 [Nonomuraea sp. PA05]
MIRGFLLDDHEVVRRGVAALLDSEDGREVRSRVPGLACLMLTSFADDDALFDAVAARPGRPLAPGPPFPAGKTVRNYVSSLLSKLDMQRRIQAAALAARLRADRKQ